MLWRRSRVGHLAIRARLDDEATRDRAVSALGEAAVIRDRWRAEAARIGDRDAGIPDAGRDHLADDPAAAGAGVREFVDRVDEPAHLDVAADPDAAIDDQPSSEDVSGSAARTASDLHRGIVG